MQSKHETLPFTTWHAVRSSLARTNANTSSVRKWEKAMVYVYVAEIDENVCEGGRENIIIDGGVWREEEKRGGYK